MLKALFFAAAMTATAAHAAPVVELTLRYDNGTQTFKAQDCAEANQFLSHFSLRPHLAGPMREVVASAAPDVLWAFNVLHLREKTVRNVGTQIGTTASAPTCE